MGKVSVYESRKIGTKDVVQEDRIILVPTGDNAPTAATGYTIVGIGTINDDTETAIFDIYLEYRQFEMNFAPV